MLQPLKTDLEGAQRCLSFAVRQAQQVSVSAFKALNDHAMHAQ